MHIKKLVAVVQFLCLGMVTSHSSPQPITVSITRSNSNMKISWNSENGQVYHLLSTTNLNSANPSGWKTNVSYLLSGGTTTSVTATSATTVASRQFYKVQSPDIIAILGLTNGQTVSNRVRIGFSVDAVPDVQVIELEDLNSTNGVAEILGMIDMRSPMNRFFDVDTVALKNGTHRLRLHVIDDYGFPASTTGDLAREGYSPTVSIQSINPISLNGFDGTTQQRFQLSFSTVFSNGGWGIAVSNNLGTRLTNWTGSIAGSISNGEISRIDVDRWPENYPTLTITNISYTVTVTNSSGSVLRLSTNSVIVGREGMQCFVLEQNSYFAPGPGINRTGMLFTALSDFNNYPMDHFNLRTLGAEWDARKWNILTNNTDWQRANQYLLGGYVRPPSHVFMWTKGRQTGYAGTINLAQQISTVTLSNLTSKYRPTVGFFGGHSDYALMRWMIDPRQRSLDEIIRKGKLPSFGCELRLNTYASSEGQSDVSADIADFWSIFIDTCFVVDGDGRTVYTFREALAAAGTRYNGTVNPVAKYFDWVGCIDLYADEITLDYFPDGYP